MYLTLDNDRKDIQLPNLYLPCTHLPSPPSLLLSEKDMVEWCTTGRSEEESMNE